MQDTWANYDSWRKCAAAESILSNTVVCDATPNVMVERAVRTWYYNELLEYNLEDWSPVNSNMPTDISIQLFFFNIESRIDIGLR